MAPRFQSWAEAASYFEKQGESYVLVTVLAVKGSSPRDEGTKMLVTASETIATIGGGQLEYSAIDKARQLLVSGENQQQIEEFPLGAKVGQCCGGHVTLLFECFAIPAHSVAVFGAGHVARALITILAQLPLNIHWIDSREQEFPKAIPDNVTKRLCEDPESVIAELPAHSHVVIMTHNHPLDYALMEAALKRGDCAYIGVIGSTTKAKRFQLRLAYWGFSDQSISQVSCPIGHPDIGGKRPMEVAVSIAAELIARFQALDKRSDNQETQAEPLKEFPSLSWDGLNKRLNNMPNDETKT